MNEEAATEDPVLGPPHAHPEGITRPPKKDAGIGALGSSLAATAAPTVLLPVGGGRLSATACGSVGAGSATLSTVLASSRRRVRWLPVVEFPAGARASRYSVAVCWGLRSRWGGYGLRD